MIHHHWLCCIGLLGLLSITAAGLCDNPSADLITPKGCIPTDSAKAGPQGLADRVIHEKSGIELVLIPAGRFAMGTSAGQAGSSTMPLRTITIAQPFYIGKTEVTNAQYRRFLQASDYDGKADTDPAYDLYLKHLRGKSLMSAEEDYPIVWVSWKNARAFCAWAGLALPSEAQWEYAARAGTKTSYYWGDDQQAFPGYGWGLTNSNALTHPVGKLKPNAFGLYDMLGNVWEWTADDYIYKYDGAPTDGSARKADVMTKSLRGGAWSTSNSPVTSSCAARFNSAPGNASNDVGFRVVLPLSRPQRTLAKDGQTDYVIVVPEKIDKGTAAVVDDLVATLKQMTGATFPVVADTANPVEHEIVIGPGNARLKSLGLEGLGQSFAQGEYEIRTVGPKLVITGGPKRSTINGIYGFLQDHLDCRWLTPGCQYIPSQASLVIDDILDRQKPAFRWRSTDYPSHWDATWLVRNRFNESKAAVAGQQAWKQVHDDPRSIGMANYWQAHSFCYIPESLYQQHPEYYREENGKRILDPVAYQRAYCLTNPGFASWLAEHVKQRLRAEPDREFVSMTHGDTSHLCRCESCQESYRKYDYAATFMLFYNKVAEQVAREFPDARLMVLAYGITFKPNVVAMHPNIRIVWCPISADYAHAFDQGQINPVQDYVGQLKHWLGQSKQLGIWYYQYQTDNLLPRPGIATTARDFQIFESLGVDQIFVEFATTGRKTKPSFDGDKSDFPCFGDPKYGYFIFPLGQEHLRAYLVARLLWDPTYDIDTGIREFSTIYYGPAGEEMIQYFNLLESLDSYEPSESRFRGLGEVHMSNSFAPKLKYPVIEKLDALLATARQKAKDNPQLLRRVEMAQMSIDLATLVYAPADAPLRKVAFERFFALAEEIGYDEICRTIVTPQDGSMKREAFQAVMAEPEKLNIPGTAPLGKNVLDNSSFETDINADGIPDGWSAIGEYLPEGYQCDPAGVRIDSSKAKTGKQSVLLEKSPKKGMIVSLRKTFDVSPGQNWQLSCAAQTQMKKGSLWVTFTALNKDGQFIRHLGSAEAPTDTKGQWQPLVAEAIVDDNTHQFMVEALLYNDGAEGKAWIDDFQCHRIQKQETK